MMARVRAQRIHEDADVSTMDGVRVTTDDGWFLLRASGTEPVVRVTAEAREAEAADRLLAKARSPLE